MIRKRVFSSRFLTNAYLKYRYLQEQNPLANMYKLVLYFCSGGMRGIFGAGFTEGLHACGLQNLFDIVIGVSTGAANGAYFLGGAKQASIGASIYSEDLPSKFVLSRWPPIANIKFVYDLISDGDKKIDCEAIIKHSSQFYILVTDAVSGASIMMDAKGKRSDIPFMIAASISMPALSNADVFLNDRQYIDGAVGSPFPLQEILKTFKPTDILVVTNRSQQQLRRYIRSRSMLERYVILRKNFPVIRDKACTRTSRLIESLAALKKNETINSHIVWGPSNAHLLTVDPKKLEIARAEGFRSAIELFKSITSI